MALTPFQSRVRATVVPVRAPQQSTGIGDALTVLGRTAGQIADNNAQTEERVAAVDHQIAMRERERGDDDLALSVAVEQAKAAQRLRIFDEENQNAADYEKRKAAEVDKEVSALRGMIGANDRVNKRFLPTLTTFAETEKADAVVYATRVRAKATGEQFEAMVATAANIAYTDPAKAEPVIAALLEAHRGRTDIPEALKPAVERKLLEPIRVSQINGAIDGGKYDAVEKELKAGTFDTVIGPEQKNRLLDRIEVERRAAVVAAEQAQADIRTDAREAVKAVEEKVKLGINPSQSEIAQVRAAALKAGLPDADIIGLDGLGIQIGLNRSYNETADPMGTKASAAATRLQAKIAAGTASETEQVSYAHLKGIADARATSAGKALRETAAQGVQGRQAVLGQLAALPADQRFTAAQAAADGLGYLAMVTEPVQAGALRGMEDLKANAKLIDDKKASAAFTAATRTAQLGLSEETVQGHMQVANALYVDWTKQAGASEAEFNPTLYQRAVRMAFGGVQREGQWVGGLGLYRGRSVVLPDNYSDDQFDRTIARLTFADAVYSDGSKATKADVIANYAPVYVGDNSAGKPIYVFRNRAGQELKMKDGRAFPVAMP